MHPWCAAIEGTIFGPVLEIASGEPQLFVDHLCCGFNLDDPAGQGIDQGTRTQNTVKLEPHITNTRLEHAISPVHGINTYPDFSRSLHDGRVVALITYTSVETEG